MTPGERSIGIGTSDVAEVVHRAPFEVGVLLGANHTGIFDIFGCRACDDRDCAVIRKGHRRTQATPAEKILRYHDRCHRVVQCVGHVGDRRRGWRGIPRPAIAAIRAYCADAVNGTAAAVIADAVRGVPAQWVALFAA